MLNISFKRAFREERRQRQIEDRLFYKATTPQRQEKIENQYNAALNYIYDLPYLEEIPDKIFYERLEALKEAKEAELLNINLIG